MSSGTCGGGRVLLADGLVGGLIEGVRLRNGLTADLEAGAGIKVTACSNLVIRSCVIENNQALNTALNLGNLTGGGAYILNSYLLLTNTIFRANLSQTAYASTMSHALGGGAAILGGAAVVSDCLFIDNQLIAARNASGSGLYLAGGIQRVEHSVFTGNYSPTPQGGTAYNRGDALHVDSAATVVTVFNSLFSANFRGAFHLENGTLSITNATVVGHGRYGLRRVAGTLNVVNSIFWQNDQDTLGTVGLNNSLTGVDPRFERGLYLAGTSPAIDGGATSAASLGLAGRTTAADGTLDSGLADLGYHFRAGAPFSVADDAVRFDPLVASIFVAPAGNDGNRVHSQDAK